MDIMLTFWHQYFESLTSKNHKAQELRFSSHSYLYVLKQLGQNNHLATSIFRQLLALTGYILCYRELSIDGQLISKPEETTNLLEMAFAHLLIVLGEHTSAASLIMSHVQRWQQGLGNGSVQHWNLALDTVPCSRPMFPFKEYN